MSKTICVDFGHGCNTGSRSGNFIEDNLINVTGPECVRLLKEYGFNVIQTRDLNSTLTLSARANISNNANADFFISIHYNAGGGEGFESIRSLRENVVSVGIANNIIKRLPTINQITRSTPIYTRVGSDGKDWYGVLRNTKCPALIVEGAFLDNSKDQNRINSDAKLKGFGRIYAEAIAEYFGVNINNDTDNTINQVTDITSTKGVVTVLPDSILNVRSYPSMSSVIIDRLCNGTELNLLYLINDLWWAISYDNEKSRGIAYVSKQYVKTLD